MIKKLLIELNQVCNLNCEYCFYRDYDRDKEVLQLENLKSIIKNYPNLEKVYLTGGEATINKDFLDIVNEFKNNNIDVVVFTNGIKLNTVENLEKYVNPVDKFLITYDHFKESYKYRLKLDTTLDTIKKIISIDSNKLEVKVCINNKNIKDLDDIFKFLIDLGVKHFSINLIHNIESNDENFELTNEEFNYAFEVIDKYKDYFNKTYINYLKDFFFNHNMKIEDTCIAGNTFKFINCKGEEYICPANFGKKGNCLSKECICIWEMFYEE